MCSQLCCRLVCVFLPVKINDPVRTHNIIILCRVISAFLNPFGSVVYIYVCVFACHSVCVCVCVCVNTCVVYRTTYDVICSAPYNPPYQHTVHTHTLTHSTIILCTYNIGNNYNVPVSKTTALVTMGAFELYA